MKKYKAIYPIPYSGGVYQAGELVPDLKGKDLEQAIADGHVVEIKEKKKVKHGKNS